METDYNFWADLLTTYRSNPDWLKFLWLVIPAALLTLAGHGVTRLIRAVIGSAPPPAHSPPPSPPPPPAARYRGMVGARGEVYLEPVPEREQLPDLSGFDEAQRREH